MSFIVSYLGSHLSSNNILVGSQNVLVKQFGFSVQLFIVQYLFWISSSVYNKFIFEVPFHICFGEKSPIWVFILVSHTVLVGSNSALLHSLNTFVKHQT